MAPQSTQISRNHHAIVVARTFRCHVAEANVLNHAFDIAFFRWPVPTASARQKLKLTARLDPEAGRLLVARPIILAGLPHKRGADMARAAAKQRKVRATTMAW